MRASICLCIVVLLALIGSVGAIPTTGAATAIGNNNATLHCTGATGSTIIQWGVSSTWQGLRTGNVTPVAGAVDITIRGAPITTSSLYYFRCADTTGYGSVLSFTTGAAVPIPTSTLEDPITNLTRNKFDLTMLPSNLVFPYTILFPGAEDTATTIILMIIFTGIWFGMLFKSKSTHTGLMMGILIISLLSTAGAARLGLPGELLSIAQAAMYASAAGLVLSIFRK